MAMSRWSDAEALLSRRDPALRKVIRAVGPCLLKPDRRQPYATLLRSIAHQQLHGKAAETIFGRFLTLYKGEVPSPDELLATEEAALRGCGFSASKVAALRDVAAHTRSGLVPTRQQAARMENEALIARLTQVRGVGRWTVEMLLMFSLARPDVLPVDDFGIREGYKVLHGLPAQPSPRELRELGERWGPWRTVASWYLWRALELSRQPG
jgi:DNA-3-methyladenine glycosylase II